MRKFLIIALIIFPINTFSQILIQGKIQDINGEVIPGSLIEEIGTSNKTVSNLEGRFSLQTIGDSCSISFSFIGLIPKTLYFSGDSTVTIILDDGDFYNTRWMTIGGSYDVYNSMFGLLLSNGIDEEPFIHFEDFQDNFLIKIYGETDFYEDYSYGAEIGLSYIRIPYLARLSLEYSLKNFESDELFFKNLNISSKIGYFKNTLLLFKAGYQELHEINNFGLTIGIEQNIKLIYFGFSSSYYFDYFNYCAYLQIGLYKSGLWSLRMMYNHIDDINLLTLGLHYSFIRNNNQ